MYYLAKNFHSEGWSLEPYEDLDSMKRAIINGMTYGQEFKILKELNLTIQEKDDESI